MDGKNTPDILTSEIRESYERIGIWGWLGLYLTGAVLIFVLLIHLFVVHITYAQPITLKTVVSSLNSPFLKTIDIALLLFAITHGMIGVRKLILDLELFKKRGSLVLNWSLFVIGIALFAWGLVIFSGITGA